MLLLKTSLGRRHYYLHLTDWEKDVTEGRAADVLIIDRAVGLNISSLSYAQR